MITDYQAFWPERTPRCEVLTCRSDSTHVLRIDNDAICLCDFHIGKMVLPCMSLQYTGATVSVQRIGIELERNSPGASQV